jgi:cell division protein FtsI/penicillin-binding protein 2
MATNSNPTLKNTLETWRLLVFGAVLAFTFFIYVIRLFTLQIIQGPEWLAQAEENRISQINLPAQRGIITDRNGTILAANIPSYNVVITRSTATKSPPKTHTSPVYRSMASPKSSNMETPPHLTIRCASPATSIARLQ